MNIKQQQGLTRKLKILNHVKKSKMWLKQAAILVFIEKLFINGKG